MYFLKVNIRCPAIQLFNPLRINNRRVSFLAVERERTNVVLNYMRRVLANRSDCVLFDIKTHPILQCCENEINDLVLETAAINPTRPFTSKKVDKLIIIDHFCLAKYKKWNSRKQLYVLDIWHTIRRVRIYTSTQKIQNNLINQIPDMTETGHILQALYYTAWLRKSLNRKQVEKIQQKLLDIRNSLSIDEQSIFCVALVKCAAELTNAEMVDGLITSIMTSDPHNCNSVSITSIVKAIRWYSTPDNLARTKLLQEKLIPYAKQTDIKGLIHIALLGYNLNHFNYYLIDIIIRRLLENLDKIRIKDVERVFLILSALTASKFKVSDGMLELYQKVQEYLLNSLETQHPDTMIKCVAYLTMCGVINMELIEWSLADGLEACSKHKKTIPARDILIVDTFTKINLAKYNGPSLNDALCAKYRSEISASLDGHNKKMADIILEMFSEHNLPILPHRIVPYSSTPDLIFVYDKKANEAKTFSLRSLKCNTHIIKGADLHKNDPNLLAVAIVTSSWQQMLHSKNAHHGHFKHELDQLKLLGFKTIIIPHTNWNNFDNVEAKKRYLIRELHRYNVFLFKK